MIRNEVSSRYGTSSYVSSTRLHRSTSIETYHVRVYLTDLQANNDFTIIDALKNTSSEDIVRSAASKQRLGRHQQYELVETFFSGGKMMKERRLDGKDNPVRIQLLWPKSTQAVADVTRTEYRFYLRKREPDKKIGAWVQCAQSNNMDDYIGAFVLRTDTLEYPDLCNLPDLNETTLLDNLKSRFEKEKIYTYIGSILISVNPFKYYPIYNPKDVRMYQNKRLSDNPPHVFAIADAAYHKMLREKENQCVVISGESGSGKTESTNLLLSQLSALSQKGVVIGDGVEQTILGAGPVLEAFGNAKTVHNNNSSRFGKFIQVNYKENGIVHGAVVEKYLLEKSRLVHQAPNERNYHVFYYLLTGSSDEQKERLGLTQPENFHYLSQYAEFEESMCYEMEDADGIVDECQEFERLRQSMETVGFSKDTQQRIWQVLAGVLHLGNIEFGKKRHGGHHDAVSIGNPDVITRISSLLMVKESTLTEALTMRKTQAGGDTVIMPLDMPKAQSTRDAMAKCLYSALFDWIVLQVNQALISKRDFSEHKGNSIGVLDIFGFEDFGQNSFEQFCINYANEHLQQYFNQHVFKYEQEEYVKENIKWQNIEFADNKGCLDLFSKRPTGLLHLLDEECSFPGANNQSLLTKFNSQHKSNEYFESPQMREDAFFIMHYAGKVKYSIHDFREKNMDMMRHDVMLVLKNSSQTFVRELVGYDPVAMLRWSIVRVFFRSYFAFQDAGKRYRSRDLGPTKYGSSMRKLSESGGRAPPSAFNASMRDSAVSATGGSAPSTHRSIGGVFQVSRALIRLRRTHTDPDQRRSRRKLLIIEKSASVDSVPTRAQLPGGTRSSCNALWKQNGELSEYEYKVMRRATRVHQKSKQYKPKTHAIKQLRDLQRKSMLQTKTPVISGARQGKSKQKPPSVSAQFNFSLQKLLETLNKSNPFFIRCIKSNMDKKACYFNEEVVLRQLQYTGMLATVRIRQSGYNYRVSFQVFRAQYRILLPRGAGSTREEIEGFLRVLDINQTNYQIGTTKVFLREAEKMILDQALHLAIMTRIVRLQHWLRAMLERQRFVRLRRASVVIQAGIRRFLAQQELARLRCICAAATLIQRQVRNYLDRKRLQHASAAVTLIQAHCRGYLVRKRLEKPSLSSAQKGKGTMVSPGAEQLNVPFADDYEEPSTSDSESDSAAEDNTEPFTDPNTEPFTDPNNQPDMLSIESLHENHLSNPDLSESDRVSDDLKMRSFSDSGTRSLDSQDLNFELDLVPTRVLSRSTSHQTSVKDKPLDHLDKTATPFEKYPVLPENSKLESTALDQSQTSTCIDDAAPSSRIVSRDTSLDGEFEVPEPPVTPTSPLQSTDTPIAVPRRSSSKRKTRPFSLASRATDLDAVIAAQTEQSRRQDAEEERMREQEKDEWNRLEVEFKSSHGVDGNDIELERGRSLDIPDQLSPTGSSASEHSVFGYSGTDRKLRYMVRDSFESTQELPEGDSDVAKEHNLGYAQDKAKDMSGVIDKYSGEKHGISAGGDEVPPLPRSQPPSHPNTPTDIKGPPERPFTDQDQSQTPQSDTKPSRDTSVIDIVCDTCQALGMRASHRSNCPDCGKLRLEAERARSVEPSDLSRKDSSSRLDGPRRRSLRDSQRSVKFVQKKVYGDEGLISSSSQASETQNLTPTATPTKNDAPPVETNHDPADVVKVNDVTRRTDIVDASRTPVTSFDALKKNENYVVKEDTDGVCIVERAKDTPKTHKLASESMRSANVDRSKLKAENQNVPSKATTPTTSSLSVINGEQYTPTSDISASSQKRVTPIATTPSSAMTSPMTSSKTPVTSTSTATTPASQQKQVEYFIKKKYRQRDPLQSSQKTKAASTSNLLGTNVTFKPKTRSTSRLEPSSVGGSVSSMRDMGSASSVRDGGSFSCVRDEDTSSRVSPRDLQQPEMNRNEPARKPVKPNSRNTDRGTLSGSDDGSLDRLSAKHSEAGSVSSQRSSRSSMDASSSSRLAGRRRSEDLGVLPGEALVVYDAEPGSSHRRKYSDETSTSMENMLDVSYRPQGPPQAHGDVSGLMNKSTSEDLLYPAPRPLRPEDRRKRMSMPNVRKNAPLATQESLEAPVEIDPNTETRHLVIERDVLKFSMPTSSTDTTPQPGDHEGSNTTSPFSKSMLKNLKSKFTGSKGRKKSAEDLDDSEESSVDEVKGAYPPQDRKLAWAESDKAHARDSTVDNASANQKQAKSTASHRNKTSPSRRQYGKSKKQRPRISKAEGGKWSVSKTSEWQYPTKTVVKDNTELKQLASFMFSKKTEWEKSTKRTDSVMEKVFNRAFNQFTQELMIADSLTKDKESKAQYGYHTLMLMFEKSFRNLALEEKDSKPDEYITIGINSFRSYLDEFYKKKINKELPDIPKVKKEKKRKKEKEKEVFEVGGHTFSQVPLNIHTVCEMCHSRMFMSGYVCKVCQYAVHKKCAKNSSVQCKDYQQRARQPGKVFGVEIMILVGKSETLPRWLETLFSEIEKQGLYTVGIYRKTGAQATVRQLEKELNADASSVKFDEQQVHALASLLKKFLRDMPEPLMTFDLYDDFIRGAEIEDIRERTHCIYGVVEKLPRQHFLLLERLINHLARIANYHSINKMTPNALAIVFAPTIVRTNANLPVQESLLHVSKQSRCVQAFIEEHLRRFKRSLKNMQTLDNMASAPHERLSALTRQSITDESGAPGPVVPDSEEQLQNLAIEERERVKELMTHLALCSSDDLDSTGDEIDDDDDDSGGRVRVKSLSASPRAKREKRQSLYRTPTPVLKDAPPAPWSTTTITSDTTGASGGAEAPLTGRGIMTSEEFL